MEVVCPEDESVRLRESVSVEDGGLRVEVHHGDRARLVRFVVCVASFRVSQ